MIRIFKQFALAAGVCVTALGVASTASAQELVLEIDRATGAGRLVGPATGQTLASYDILSDDDEGLLTPDTWLSLEDQGIGDFFEETATSKVLRELNFGESTTVFEEGISLGLIYDVSAGPSDAEIAGDLTLLYGDADLNPFEGTIVVVPEPATASLLACGALVLLRRKRP